MNKNKTAGCGVIQKAMSYVQWPCDSKEDIVIISKSYAKRRKAKFQSCFTQVDRLMINRLVNEGVRVEVKLLFDNIEHMWVEVKTVDCKQNTFTGILRNTPLEANNYKYGDRVTANLNVIDDIHALRLPRKAEKENRSAIATV